jgi:hypothetical protein
MPAALTQARHFRRSSFSPSSRNIKNSDHIGFCNKRPCEKPNEDIESYREQEMVNKNPKLAKRQAFIYALSFKSD